MPKSPSNPLESLILESKKLWATKSARLFDSQVMMTSSKCIQIRINILLLCTHQQKTRDLKLKIFFQSKLQVFRGLEQLSSLFWRWVMAIYKMGVIHPSLEFVGVKILTTFWFLCHNFGSRYARKSIKGSKDSDNSLVSKKNSSQKIGSLDWRLWPGKVGRKNAKAPPLVTSPRGVPRPEKNFFFQSELEDLLNP